MKPRRATGVLSSLLLLSALALAGPACVVRGTGPVWVVDVEPPPPRPVGVVVARPGYVWIDGYWAWIGGHWTWREGYWERERAGHVWIQGSWIQTGGRWHWRAGRWQPRHHHRAPPPRPAPRPRTRDHR